MSNRGAFEAIAYGARPCRWCGADVRPVEDRGEWIDETDSTTCEIHIEDCPACEDGESHPHEGEAK